MRVYLWLAALVVLAGLASPAKAQSAVTFGGNNRNVTYSVINTSNSTVPIASPQSAQSMGSSLFNFFHWPTQMTSSKVIGGSVYPSRNQLPGTDYLQGFGYRRGGQ